MPRATGRLAVRGWSPRSWRSAHSKPNNPATPSELSPIPGPKIRSASRRTFRSVSNGKTVSRCADTTSGFDLPLPGKQAKTFPSASSETASRPSTAKRWRTNSARCASPNGGAGICWIVTARSSTRADKEASIPMPLHLSRHLAQ
ncbi:MAG: hypothetical protein M5U05_04280 [Anaerolineales bacterium]|nr:hypothetical protein [Anaerolineales bacterium]